ncbi:DNA polymerase lambda isoform X11 [Homo sapiens]|uniref:DNA polymerase lambda isoform X11 n=1 Tax=Homo sapiens TaxID=9606 RepID=UPI0007DC5CB9|nr:DNA polymerase lambda isoform X11 [Homo sapiens]|eukprot:XP_016871577.1 DNA polymerase lambda isoform X12 [Homo sapiens]
MDPRGILKAFPKRQKIHADASSKVLAKIPRREEGEEAEEWLSSLRAHVVRTGIGRARAELFEKQIVQHGGQLCPAQGPGVTHIVVDEGMDYERALRLLRLPQLPPGAQLVKSAWLSLCLQERRLVDVAGFSIFIPSTWTIHSPARQSRMLLFLLAPMRPCFRQPFLLLLLPPGLCLLPKRQKRHQTPKPSPSLMMKPVMGKKPRLVQLIWKPSSVATTPPPLREIVSLAQPLLSWISGSVHSPQARRRPITTSISQRSWKFWPKPTVFRETSGGPWAMPRPSMPSRASISLSPRTRSRKQPRPLTLGCCVWHVVHTDGERRPVVMSTCSSLTQMAGPTGVSSAASLTVFGRKQSPLLGQGSSQMTW